MTERITVDQLEVMAESLRLYDVVDGGWVHEGRGLDFNLRHIGWHLADMIDRKDFTDRKCVVTEIAPDCVQYGLRIARWSQIPVAEIEIPYAIANDTFNRAVSMSSDSSPEFLDREVIIRAMGILARERHEVDHMEGPIDALQRNEGALLLAAGMLLHAAEISADYYDGIDLERAFDERLAQLRSRHNIPRLEEA